MTGMELLTAVREGAGLVVVVLHDGFLNRIRLQQLAQVGRGASVDLLNPDFAALAEAVGARHVLLEGDPTEVLRELVSGGGVALAEVRVGDSAVIRRSRVKGLARGTARRVAGPTLRALWRKRRRPP